MQDFQSCRAMYSTTPKVSDKSSSYSEFKSRSFKSSAVRPRYQSSKYTYQVSTLESLAKRRSVLFQELLYMYILQPWLPPSKSMKPARKQSALMQNSDRMLLLNPWTSSRYLTMALRPGYNAPVLFFSSSILGGQWSALVCSWGVPKTCGENWAGYRRLSNLLQKRPSSRSISLRHILDRFHSGWPPYVCGPLLRAALRSWISSDLSLDGKLFGHFRDVIDQPEHSVLAAGVGLRVSNWNRQRVSICAERRLPTIIFHRKKSTGDGYCSFWEQCWWVTVNHRKFFAILILFHSGNTIPYRFSQTPTNDRFWLGNPRSCFHHDGNSNVSNLMRQIERNTVHKPPTFRHHRLARNPICFICILVLLRLSCSVHPILLYSTIQHRTRHHNARLRLLPPPSRQRRHLSRPPG